MSQLNRPFAGRYAVISVTNKTGVVSFAKALIELGYEVLSTGGTARLLKESKLQVTEVADFTESSEFFGGRVKTLHPRIHGGILMDRASSSHQKEALEHRIEPIDLVVVNLYQFADEAVAKNLNLEEAIEHIDIGGPTMLRAAAKNFQHTLPVIDPMDYDAVIQELRAGGVSLPSRIRLAHKVFTSISQYDQLIGTYLSRHLASAEKAESLPQHLSLSLTCQQALRYGENPQQSAGFFTASQQEDGLQNARVIQGKELSYNNFLDVDAAANLVAEFQEPTIAIIKHTNPCGVAQGSEHEALVAVYERALAGDPKSAFGGIVAVNRPIDGNTAEKMSEIFLECIVAPGFDDEALAIFARKKNLRILDLPFLKAHANGRSSFSEWNVRSIRGGFLVQTPDRTVTPVKEWRQVAGAEIDAKTQEDLRFAWTLVKHVKSNAIVFVKDRQTITVGAGQMSRVDAVQFAIQKAKDEGKSLKGAVLASDAFFPFRDSVDDAAKTGIKAIVQPGGSVRDDESIQACVEHQIAMFLTGKRHFKH